MLKLRKKQWLLLVVCLVTVIIGGLFAASQYLYYFAFEPQPRLITKYKQAKATMLVKDQHWLDNAKQKNWYQTSATQNLQLHAVYFPATQKTNKTIVVAHGYRENHRSMASYIHLFHRQGYNVLAPDDRGAVGSEGKYIGFGWPDRLDYLKWLQLLLKKEGSQQKIGLFGVSMGGATVMMISGEHLSKQVKAICEDAGYSSIEGELTHELKAQFNLPKQPLITTADWAVQQHTGFSFKKASSVDQLKRNHLPTFFIHGGKDNFVPTKMVYQNYRASAGPKQLWVVPGAAHAMSYYDHPQLYSQKVSRFFAKYLK